MRHKINFLILSLGVFCAISGCGGGGGGGGGEYGALNISSTPSNATVLLDGENKGTTPITMNNVSAGSHNVKLEKNLSKGWEKSVVINANQTTVIAADEAILQSDDDYPPPPLKER